MKKFSVLFVVCLACLAGGSGCASETAVSSGLDAHQTTAQPTLPDSDLTISNLIQLIRQSPQEYLDEEVEITGYYHGWDLLDEVGDPPPVTRSDWVIADESGALYVTGMLPPDLNPASRDEMNSLIHLVAKVAMSGEQVYLEALSIEVLPEH